LTSFVVKERQRNGPLGKVATPQIAHHQEPTMTSFRFGRAALAAAAFALCAPVWAASNGSFTTGPITFQVIDLRPDDGIPPSVSFETLPGQEGGVAAQGAQRSPQQLELRAQ
jgi:hypothetical protein